MASGKLGRGTGIADARSILTGLSYLALGYSFLLVFGAVLDWTWVFNKVAGGAYTDGLPAALKVVYALFSLLMPIQAWFIHQVYQRGPWSATVQKVLTIGLVVNFISFILQLLSKSEAEQLNALPAGVLVMTYWVLRRKI